MPDGVKEISDVAHAIRQDTQQLIAHTNKLKLDLPNIAQPPPKMHDQCCQTDTPPTLEDVNVQIDQPTTTNESGT